MLSFALHNYDLAMAQLIGNIRAGLLEIDELLGQIQSHRVSHGGSTRQVNGPASLSAAKNLSLSLAVSAGKLHRERHGSKRSIFDENS